MHEQKFKIRSLISQGQYKEAAKLLEEYESKANLDLPLEHQFVLLYSTLISGDTYSLAERLSRLEEAIRLSYPKYGEGEFPGLLSYEEIIILNNIAICYGEKKDFTEAIDILYNIKRHHESGVVNREEVLRTQTMILYNLSKYLGLAGRYDECIEICDLGIKISRETGRCDCLYKLLYNRAWSLTKRKSFGDMAKAEEMAKTAIFAAVAMGDKRAEKHYTEFFVRNFPKSNLLLY